MPGFFNRGRTCVVLKLHGNERFVHERFAMWPMIGANTSHTRTVVRECFKGDEASQWKRPKFDPSPHQNPLSDLHKNWQALLRPERTGMQNFVAIGSGVSVHQIRDFAVRLG